ncbi:MAG: competence type IV pilus assembly protein ComGB [Heyndrickxia sp.]
MKEQGIFLNRLGDMLQNGYSMADAIDFLGRINKKDRPFTGDMLIKLQNGIAIHEIFSEKHFDKKACAQMFFAEKHGNISFALKEAGNYLVRKDNERKTIIKLLQYPLILIGILILVLFLLKTLLLSQFADLYTSMDYHPSPVILFFTQLMEEGPTIISIFGVAILLVVFLTSLLFSKKTPVEKAEWIIRIPVIRTYSRLFNSQFFARECSFLLQSGFSINEVLACMAQQHYRPLVKNIAELIRKDLTLGYSFSNSLSKFSFYDPQLIIVIQHGEKNGRLDQELRYYSRFCLGQMQEKMEKVFKILQPLMFIMIGLLVLIVYMSIMLPMFDMMDSI